MRYNFFYASANGGGGPEDLSTLSGQACVNTVDNVVKRSYTVVDGVPETVSFVWETCDGTILPVDLMDFSGEVLPKRNRLNWTTAREENVQWHILERSNSGRNNWQEVARTQGARSGTEERGYSLDDQAPPASAYYRLRSVDYDGSEGFSPIVFLERDNAVSTIKAYPNPAGDRLEISLTSQTEGPAQLSLFAPDGREVLSTSVTLVTGINNLSLNLQKVPAGAYFVRVGEEVLRVVKR